MEALRLVLYQKR